MTSLQPPTAPSHLDDIPISNILLETSIGDVGLFALDEHTVKVRAGGNDRYQPETTYGPVQVNRLTIDIAARYGRDEHGTWKRVSAGYGDDVAYRAGTHTSPTRAVRDKVETTLATAITEWAKTTPHVLAAAQHATNARAIADARRRLDKLDEQRAEAQQRVTDLEHAHDAYAARWARALPTAPQATTPDTPATVGSVAYCGDAAHYIVWANGKDVAWGVVNGLRLLPEAMLLDAVRAHLHERDATTLAKVKTWHTSEYADTNGTLDAPEVAHAAETVGDRLGILHRHRTFRPATAQTIAEEWTSQSQDRGTLPDDEQPLREALDRLADPATVRAAGHAQLLRALTEHATTAADRLNAEMVAREVPPNPDVKETVRLIRQYLKRRSGRAWSVTHGRGTAYGWITIHVPPAQRNDRSEMSDADREELARLLVDLPTVEVQPQAGVSVPDSTAYRREYIARARGLTPTEYGTQYWD